mmetsp:Transcript_1921/g.6870  ORF Transcript_1921/g.6870 Transcript_1921/m.6870 type:complete len:369 (-) Transcript_1921:724-1830(-)
MGTQNSHPSTPQEKILHNLYRAYPNELSMPLLRKILSETPSPMHLSQVEESFRVDFSSCPTTRQRLLSYFQPLSPSVYIERLAHLQLGGSERRCALLFHLFCHRDHMVRVKKDSLHQNVFSPTQFHMNFQEFQAAIDLLVKGRMDMDQLPQFRDDCDVELLHEEHEMQRIQQCMGSKSHKCQNSTKPNYDDRYLWLFQIADEFHEGRIDLREFSRVVCDSSPILNLALREMIKKPLAVVNNEAGGEGRVERRETTSTGDGLRRRTAKRALKGGSINKFRDSLVVYAWYSGRRATRGRSTGDSCRENHRDAKQQSSKTKRKKPSSDECCTMEMQACDSSIVVPKPSGTATIVNSHERQLYLADERMIIN